MPESLCDLLEGSGILLSHFRSSAVTLRACSLSPMSAYALAKFHSTARHVRADRNDDAVGRGIVSRDG